MTYDWASGATHAPGSVAWFDEQDRLSSAAHFATDDQPFDRLTPYPALAGREVLQMGTGSGFPSGVFAGMVYHCIETDLPDPNNVRKFVLPRAAVESKNRYLRRFGNFVTFRAEAPLV